MSLLNKLQKKYVTASTNYQEPFVINQEVKKFLDTHKLWDDIQVEEVKFENLDTDEQVEVDHEDYEPGKTIKLGRVLPKVAAEMKRVYDLFTSYKYYDRSIKEAKAGILHEVKEVVDSIAAKKKIFPQNLKYTVEIEDHDDYWAGEIEISYKDETKTFQPDSLVARWNDEITWDSLNPEGYFLGIEESPFFSSDFVDAYRADDRASAYKEIASLEHETDDLEKLILKLIKEQGEVAAQVLAKESKKEEEKGKYKVGEVLVHPLHGLVEVRRSDLKSVNLKALQSNALIMMFEPQFDLLRKPMSKSEASKLLKDLSKKESDPIKEYQSKLRSGKAEDFCEVLKALFDKDSLSFGERKIYNLALERVVTEIAHVQKKPTEDVREKVEEALGRGSRKKSNTQLVL